MCMNVYECRIQGIMKHQKAFYKSTNELLDIMCSFPVKGGTSRGSCALGFGACCVCKYKAIRLRTLHTFSRVLSYHPFTDKLLLYPS